MKMPFMEPFCRIKLWRKWEPKAPPTDSVPTSVVSPRSPGKKQHVPGLGSRAQTGFQSRPLGGWGRGRAVAETFPRLSRLECFIRSWWPFSVSCWPLSSASVAGFCLVLFFAVGFSPAFAGSCSPPWFLVPRSSEALILAFLVWDGVCLRNTNSGACRLACEPCLCCLLANLRNVVASSVPQLFSLENKNNNNNSQGCGEN